ncbi:MAG: hypothetical protein LBT35_00090 [Tannerella sp.]|jgi:hypothetical protein|nr:hypothetical protein [Tannerella sp.]
MIEFYEKQRMPWVFSLLPASSLIFCTATYMKTGLTDIWAFLILILAHLAVIALLVFISMETIVNDEGVYVKMLPFQWKHKLFAWETISEAYVRQYKPLFEYGGWGMKFQIKALINRGANISFSLSGNMGLQLVLNNGARILIGTHQPNELTAILTALNKTK